MSNLRIEVEVKAGTSIEVAAAEMQALADRLNIDVKARFGHVWITANVFGAAETLVDRYHLARASDPPGFFAYSNGRPFHDQREPRK